MGNQAGKTADQQGAYGGIFVKLDQEVFNPLDTLSGNIYVDLRANYPGDMLCLEVKGTEYTKWIDKEARQRPRQGGQPGEMETYYVDVQREATREIIKNDLVVYDWAARQVIRPGQYTFPFAFQIPSGLPGSFFFKSGNAVAEIKYSVEGYLKPEVEQVPRLKHKVYLTMREKVQSTIQQKELNLTKKISTWCCVDQGTISLKAAFEKDAYCPGEEARMLTEIDNGKCNLNIPNVSFQLSQTIQLSANGHGKYFHFPIRTVDLGSIAPKTSCLGDQRKSASIILPPGQEGKAKDFTADGANVDPTQFITPSAHGSLVKSDFTLSLTCNVEGCICCDGVPSVSIPIQVYAATRPRQPDPIPPANWNPQPMPQANLTITIVQLANGGQEIHIDTGAPQGGMMGGQMPPQQPGFAQPNQQMQPQFEPAKPMMNTSQQPLVNNNSFNNSAQMNNSFGNPQMNNGGMVQQQQQPQPQFQQQQQPQPQPQFQQQPQPQSQPQPQFQQQQQPQPQPQPQFQQQQQPQPINPQPVQIGQQQQQPANNGQWQSQNPNQYPQQQQPQPINPQPVQIGQQQQPANNGQWQSQNSTQYPQQQQPQPQYNQQQQQPQYNQQQPANNGQWQSQNPNQYPQQQQPVNNGQWQSQNPNQYGQPVPNQH